MIMKKLIFVIFVSLLLGVAASAQDTTTTQTSATEKKQIFRPTKSQITEVQKMLKGKGLYNGEATGKMEDDFRTAIKSYQGDNGLTKTGTLNRATLEKMGIELTESQKLIPVNPNSYASTETTVKSSSGATAKVESSTAAKTEKSSGEAKSKKVIFRATKDQVKEAQKLLKSKAMYSGEETGKLDDATRDGLKKFQEANGVKVTGTLNQVTLEKMGIELTDKQKADATRSGN